ncbi:hypothetical protein BT63DRAFT_409064 [Microthyrium microscopicum]|uniref:Uncharacterized protein n=1 Tax=Microthyrium microscopicum TaxID=703497 RepID=A0A6A6URI6_9PEZI|nr:hypothetical protein BT63DRAFT_409064 [Microthyrium microscopicum]
MSLSSWSLSMRNATMVPDTKNHCSRRSVISVSVSSLISQLEKRVVKLPKENNVIPELTEPSTEESWAEMPVFHQPVVPRSNPSAALFGMGKLATEETEQEDLTIKNTQGQPDRHRNFSVHATHSAQSSFQPVRTSTWNPPEEWLYMKRRSYSEPISSERAEEVVVESPLTPLLDESAKLPPYRADHDVIQLIMPDPTPINTPANSRPNSMSSLPRENPTLKNSPLAKNLGLPTPPASPLVATMKSHIFPSSMPLTPPVEEPRCTSPAAQTRVPPPEIPTVLITHDDDDNTTSFISAKLKKQLAPQLGYFSGPSSIYSAESSDQSDSESIIEVGDWEDNQEPDIQSQVVLPVDTLQQLVNDYQNLVTEPSMSCFEDDDHDVQDIKMVPHPLFWEKTKKRFHGAKKSQSSTHSEPSRPLTPRPVPTKRTSMIFSDKKRKSLSLSTQLHNGTLKISSPISLDSSPISPHKDFIHKNSTYGDYVDPTLMSTSPTSQTSNYTLPASPISSPESPLSDSTNATHVPAPPPSSPITHPTIIEPVKRPWHRRISTRNIASALSTVRSSLTPLPGAARHSGSHEGNKDRDSAILEECSDWSVSDGEGDAKSESKGVVSGIGGGLGVGAVGGLLNKITHKAEQRKREKRGKQLKRTITTPVAVDPTKVVYDIKPDDKTGMSGGKEWV